MTCDGPTSCTCEACRKKRHSTWEANKLIRPRKKTVTWGSIPAHQMLSYKLEEEEILEKQLAIVRQDISDLRADQ